MTGDIYFTHSNIKSRIICDWLMYNAQSILNAEMYVTFESLCVSEQRDQIPMKTGGPGDPASQSASVAVSSTSRTFN